MVGRGRGALNMLFLGWRTLRYHNKHIDLNDLSRSPGLYRTRVTAIVVVGDWFRVHRMPAAHENLRCACRHSRGICYEAELGTEFQQQFVLPAVVSYMYGCAL